MNIAADSVLCRATIICGFMLFLLAQSLAQATQNGTIDPAVAGVAFVDGSTSQVIVEQDGKRYLVDLSSHSIKEVGAADPEPAYSSSRQPEQAAPAQTATPSKAEAPKVYRPGDDLVFSVPTGRRLDRHGLYINFTHRFPYEAAFSGKARGSTLLGLDDFAVASFGFRYGVTSRLFVMAYRSPSVIGRPIELMAGYNFLDEKSGDPVNLSARFSVDGQNNFERNFTENFELTVSRSLGHRAQLYAVPTVSIHNRPVLGATSFLTNPPLEQPCAMPNAAGLDPSLGVKPCANTFSLGMAMAVDVRPTVALIAETIPTLVNGRDLGIHRPEYAFGIQKKIWRHAFTFGFTNGPGSVVSQRAGTRATYLGDPKADKPAGMFVGFDLTRQAF